jgi:thiol-disulfide isomerase/thioredoxin
MKYPAAFIIFMIFFGCSENNHKLNNSEDKKSGEIEVITADDLQKMINNRNGKSLLINVWATWCLPCVEEFPHLVKIAEEYRNNNLDFLSISVDFGKKADSLVAEFLAEQNNPQFTVYIVSEKSAGEVIELLNGKWDGSIPATFIYNPQAVQQSFILGSRDYNYFKKNIDAVLNES